VLDGATNNFVGAVGATNGANLTLVDANAMVLGATTITGNLSVTATGSILDDADNATTITAGTVSLTATNAIGASGLNNELDTNTTTLTLRAGTDIVVANAAALTDLSVTVNPGSGLNTYSVTDSASGGLTAFTVTDNGVDLLITSLTATGVHLAVTATTGNVSLTDGAIVAGTGNVTVEATQGSIVDSTETADTAAGITTSGNVTLRALGATGAIGATGAGDRVNGDVDIAGSATLALHAGGSLFVAATTALTDLSLTVNPGSGANRYRITDHAADGLDEGAFRVTDSGADLLISNVTLEGSSTFLNVSVTATTGNLRLADNAMAVGTGNVTLEATAGSILDDNAATNDSVANIATGDESAGGARTVTLRALGTTGSVGAGADTANDIDIAGSTRLVLEAHGVVNVSANSDLTDLSLTVNPGTGAHTYRVAATDLTFTVADDGANLSVTNVTGTTGTTGLNFTLTARTGSISVAGAGINVGVGNITLTAADLALTASLRGTGALLLQPFDPSSSIGIGNGAAGTFNLTTTEIGFLEEGFGSITIGGSTGTGVITVDGPVTFRDPLIIQQLLGGGGKMTINGDLIGRGTLRRGTLERDGRTDLFDDATITLRGSGGTTILNGNIVTAGNSITINDRVILSSNATLDSTDNGRTPTGAGISIAGATNGDAGGGARGLSIASGRGNVQLTGGVGADQPLQSVTIISGGAIELPTISTIGDVYLNGAVRTETPSSTSGTTTGSESTSLLGQLVGFFSSLLSGSSDSGAVLSSGVLPEDVVPGVDDDEAGEGQDEDESNEDGTGEKNKKNKKKGGKAKENAG